MAPGGDAHAGLADKWMGSTPSWFKPPLVQPSFGSKLWGEVESTVGLKALWRRTFVTTTRILLTCAIAMAHHGIRRYQRFLKGVGRKWEGSGAVAPLSQVVVTWVCKGSAWKTVPPVSAALTQSLVG